MITNLIITPNLLNGTPAPPGGMPGKAVINPDGLPILGQGAEGAEPGAFGIALDKLMKAAGLVETVAEGELPEAASGARMARGAGMETTLAPNTALGALLGETPTMDPEVAEEALAAEGLIEVAPAIEGEETELQVLEEVPIAMTVEVDNSGIVVRPTAAPIKNESGAIPAIDISAPGVDGGRKSMVMTPGVTAMTQGGATPAQGGATPAQGGATPAQGGATPAQGETPVEPGQAANQGFRMQRLEASSTINTPAVGNETKTGAETPAVNAQTAAPEQKIPEGIAARTTTLETAAAKGAIPLESAAAETVTTGTTQANPAQGQRSAALGTGATKPAFQPAEGAMTANAEAQAPANPSGAAATQQDLLARAAATQGAKGESALNQAKATQPDGQAQSLQTAAAAPAETTEAVRRAVAPESRPAEGVNPKVKVQTETPAQPAMTESGDKSTQSESPVRTRAAAHGQPRTAAPGQPQAAAPQQPAAPFTPPTAAATPANPMKAGGQAPIPADINAEARPADMGDMARRSARPETVETETRIPISNTQTTEKTFETELQAKVRQTPGEVSTRDTMDQIVKKSVFQLSRGRSEATIDLKPPHLGQIRMQIVTENQQVTMKIVTEAPLVKEMIETSIQHLKADLGAHGLTIDKMDVSVADDSRQQGGSNQQNEAARADVGSRNADGDNNAEGDEEETTGSAAAEADEASGDSAPGAAAEGRVNYFA